MTKGKPNQQQFKREKKNKHTTIATYIIWDHMIKVHLTSLSTTKHASYLIML